MLTLMPRIMPLLIGECFVGGLVTFKMFTTVGNPRIQVISPRVKSRMACAAAKRASSILRGKSQGSLMPELQAQYSCSSGNGQTPILCKC
jgi:hypothetical protein